MKTVEGERERNIPVHDRIFPTLFGAFLGLTLLKFGNPPIMEEFVTSPSNGWEVVINSPWPIHWGYIALGVVTVSGLLVAGWNSRAPGWLVAMPALWLFWECLASAHTVAEQLTNPTLKHFAACVLCFYLGLLALSRAQNLTGFWVGIACGFLLVVAFGWQQHFGGLEQTRQYFFTYIYPQAKQVSTDYLKKISSNRIFSTLFYPNALAGALLLFLPGVLWVIWQARARFTLSARRFLVICTALGALACLFWSGSKGGWLLMLLLGLVALLRFPLSNGAKPLIIICVLVLGLGCFFVKYRGFFQKGATSVSARFDYWKAALLTAKDHPVFGTGPGTFAVPYAKIKSEQSEMTRLVHNDYLEQASDSGWPGFMAYTLFQIGVLIYSGRRLLRPAAEPVSRMLPAESSVSTLPKATPTEESSARPISQLFAVWLGLLGWELQSLFEFSLYIPALAWPAFAFAGLLLGKLPKPIDKQ